MNDKAANANIASMVKCNNHYEAAFEAYLRVCRVPYVAVDEAKRSLLASGDSVKSLDFIVSPDVTVSPTSYGSLSSSHPSSDSPINWLVDVKGRRFPSGDRHKQYWKNWSTRDDLTSLGRWENLFGEMFGGLFVFAFNIVGDRSPLPAADLFEFRRALYGFVAIRLADYSCFAREISPRWDTVAMSATDFRRLARPIRQFLAPAYSSELNYLA